LKVTEGEISDIDMGDQQEDGLESSSMEVDHAVNDPEGYETTIENPKAPKCNHEALLHKIL
jgi:hypothetical protein